MMDKNKYYANTYQTPNVLIDERLKDLDCYEFTLISIVIRKTFGWGKRDEGDYISLSQFMKIAPNISRRTIINKLESLKNKGLLETIICQGKTNHYCLSTIFYSSAGDAPVDNEVVQEMHRTSAGDAPVLVQEMHRTSAGDAPTKPTIQNLLIKPTYQKGRHPAGGLLDVQLFFIEKGIADPLENAFKFFNHYEANGWVQGRGKPLKDWRAAPWGSWNFARSMGKLKVRFVNDHPNADELDSIKIIEIDREKIIKGLLDNKLKITESNIIEYHFSKEPDPETKHISYDPLEVRKQIKNQFSAGPS
jgi:hypothetical protein